MKKRRKLKLRKLTIVCIVIDVLIVAGFVLTYGPFDYFRNLLVNTAMKTMEHQYLAYIFYNEEMVEKIKSQNYFVTIDEEVDLDSIKVNGKRVAKNKYDKEILTKENDDDLYKIIDVKVGSSKGYLVAIYDSTKVQLISKEVFGTATGERVITMCERYGGVVCINGGGFVDHGMGSGTPMGYVIEDGKITWSDGDSSTKTGNIIGFNKNGKLMLLSNTTGNTALKKGVVDGLEFGPFLIVNGKSMKIVGDPWGKSPRVVIGQRKDGIVLFLVVDGQNYIDGASLQNVIDILLKYGAYNAANLDGGQSSTLIVNNKLYNNPPSAAKSTNGRYVVTGWGLIP